MIKLTSKMLIGITIFLFCAIMPRPLQCDLAAKSVDAKQAGDKQYNRLINETSPYLRQHAENPVDWYPWCAKAFAKAIEENKPIFLSIGYSTCHWCHVMAHESFEDPEVARLMNEMFVSIKVDREERPDIDNIYMDVCRMLTGGGGWPLTIIMTPNKEPFFAGTYIPKTNRYGRAGMLELIPRIKALWSYEKSKVLDSASQIVAALEQSTLHVKSNEKLDASVLMKDAFRQFSRSFDHKNAGFGKAPKFPSPQNLMFLLRHWKQTNDNAALLMVEKTLQAMRMGGIYDHAGFGFHRYSTDADWVVPHFEKMLYDQAMLSMAYIEAWQATGKNEYREVAQDIFTYVLRDMKSPEGGFYSAEDADTEGEEGAFYLWSIDEINRVLGRKHGEIITKVFNITAPDNTSGNSAGDLNKRILHLKKPLPELAREMRMPEQHLRTVVNISLKKLFTARKQRILPHKDKKILTDWNGLMIAALAKGARAFNSDYYKDTARRAGDFMLRKMRRADKRLLHIYNEGQSAQLSLAYVDDYSFLIWGLLELYETTFDVKYLKAAVNLNNELIEHFWDEKNGGFYFTADDGEKLLVRQKEFYDGAVPSGNSAAMLNTVKLARITGNVKLENHAGEISATFAQLVKAAPSSFGQFLCGLNFATGPSYEIVVAGEPDSEDTLKMLNAISFGFTPNKVVILKPEGKTGDEISQLAKYTIDQKSINGKATAYVCLKNSCKAPTTDVKKMLELMNEN